MLWPAESSNSQFRNDGGLVKTFAADEIIHDCCYGHSHRWNGDASSHNLLAASHAYQGLSSFSLE